LVNVAREFFVRDGYANTATSQLVAAAGVTRGALYHHFADKRGLFAAVVEVEAQAVVNAVRDAGDLADPVGALLAGGDAYLVSMSVPGRSRLLLIEAPVVLGLEASAALQELHGERALREGLEAASAAGRIPPLPLTSLTRCLGAAYDRAALAIANGSDPEEERAVLRALVCGLTN
jgi:AcrR family transcriptional regulator